MSDLNIAPAIHERKGHTPGPWEYTTGGINGDVIEFLNGVIEASPDGCLVIKNPHDILLIAEAPNLLAHLKFAVALIGPLIGGTAQVEAMRAAITKAEG